MRLMLVELTAEEATNPNLMTVLDRFCVGVSLAGVSVTRTIGDDSPDKGTLLPNAPGAWNPDSSLSIPPINLDTRNLGFGNPAGGAVPSTAVVVPPSTVPVAPTATLPAVPGLPPTVPPTAPTGVAPAAPVTPTNPAAGAAERDSAGLTWDGRIHSSKKSKTESGAWRYKKGLNNPGETARIEAEIRAALGVVAPTPVMPPAAPVVAAPPPPVLAPAVAQQQFDAAVAAAAQAGQVAAPVMPPPPAPPVIVTPPAGPTIASLMSMLSPHMLPGGLLSSQRQSHLFSLVGVNSLPELMPRPDLIAQLEPMAAQWIAYWQALPPGTPATTVTV